MRWFYLALVANIALVLGGASYTSVRASRVENFCEALEPGLTLGELRKHATRAGLEVEPLYQLQTRVIASGPPVLRGSQEHCKLYVDEARVLRFKAYQRI